MCFLSYAYYFLYMYIFYSNIQKFGRYENMKEKYEKRNMKYRIWKRNFVIFFLHIHKNIRNQYTVFFFRIIILSHFKNPFYLVSTGLRVIEPFPKNMKFIELSLIPNKSWLRNYIKKILQPSVSTPEHLNMLYDVLQSCQITWQMKTWT